MSQAPLQLPPVASHVYTGRDLSEAVPAGPVRRWAVIEHDEDVAGFVGLWDGWVRAFFPMDLEGRLWARDAAARETIVTACVSGEAKDQ